ncbi:hypothetical protein LMG28727_06605 [Paraburkholderia kirstenboschensis]|nr:hypothetical protein LMG28727_06605 [Paraburkholderia kirstenboschensis]
MAAGSGRWSVVVVRGGEVFDITRFVPATAGLFHRRDAAELARTAPGEPLRPVGPLIEASLVLAREASVRLLAPCDVQAIKACGVTFAVNLLERVIEGQAGGDAAKAAEVRSTIAGLIGTDLAKIKPGSEGAMKLKEERQRRNAWSHYMEVRSGPDAEVFSKSQRSSGRIASATGCSCRVR